MSDTTPEIQIYNEEAQMPVNRNGATYYRVTEAAEALGVHRNTIIYWIKEKQMEAKKLGIAEKSPYIISSEEVERAKRKMAETVVVN